MAEIHNAGAETLKVGVVGYGQVRQANERDWQTSSEVIQGGDVAFFQLPPTKQPASNDSILREAEPGKPNTVIIGCTLYRLLPDGTYTSTTNVQLNALLKNVLGGLGEGHLTHPIHLQVLGHKSIYTLFALNRPATDIGLSFPTSVSERVVIQGPFVRSVALSYSAGTGHDVAQAFSQHFLFGDYGRVRVSAPPASEVSKVVPPIGKSIATCRGK